MNRRGFLKNFLAIGGSILTIRNVDLDSLQIDFDDFTSEQIKEIVQIESIDVSNEIPENVYHVRPYNVYVITRKDGTEEQYWSERDMANMRKKYGDILKYYKLDTDKLNFPKDNRVWL